MCVRIFFFHSLNPKVSHSTEIKYLEGLINLVLSSEDLPISLSGFIHIGFLSVFQTCSAASELHATVRAAAPAWKVFPHLLLDPPKPGEFLFGL